MYATLTYNDAARLKPFRVTTPHGTRAFKTFDAALHAARIILERFRARRPSAIDTRKPITAKTPTGCPVAERRGVYRIQGRRGNVTVARDITARGRDAAIRAFLGVTDADHVTSCRALSKRNPDAKTARVRSGKGMLSAKRRRQRSGAETRHLRNALK